MVPATPAFNIQDCVAWATMVTLATLVVVVLMLAVAYTQHQDKVIVLETSVRSLSRSAERAISLTETFRNATPPINWTRVARRSIAQDENAWVNATINAQRTLRSVENLVQHVDESRMIERYTDLASTVTRILASPKVAEHVEIYSNHIIWMMNAVSEDSQQTNTLVAAGKDALRDVGEFVRSPRTHAMVNEFLNSDETRTLLHDARTLVDDVRGVVRVAADVVEQARDRHLLDHADDLMVQVRDEHLLHKAGDMYDRVQNVEDRFGRVVGVGYDFVMELLRKEFGADAREHRGLPAAPAPAPAPDHSGRARRRPAK